MCPSEWMDQMIYDLIEHYTAEVRPSGLIYLELRMRGHGVLIIEEQVKHQQMRVCYQLFDTDGRPVFEPELLFYIDGSGSWIPYAIRRHTAGQYTCAELNSVSGEFKVTDTKHQAALAVFANFWADILRVQGWIGGAAKCITQPQAMPQAEARLPPDAETLWDWVDEYGVCTATDGCWVAADGICSHGHQSWLLALDLL
jgi:hypothetical protein